MTASDIVAYIGAAAWAPQILQWLYASTKKPKLKAVSGGTAPIGYTNLGPVVGITTAISCDRRDALIKTVKLTATHEKGEKHQLSWSWLKESQTQMNMPTGERIEFGKDEPALALKVSTMTLTQKTISFVDSEFQTDFSRRMDEILHYYEYLKRTGGENAEITLMKSSQFADAKEFFSERFYWKQGRYILDLEFAIVGVSSPHKERFEIFLKKADIDLLRANVELFETLIRTQLKSYDGALAKWPEWKWASPVITALS